MIPFRRRTTLLFLGTFAANAVVMSTAGAGERDEVIAVGNHCAAYGPGVIELGNGMCGRVNGTVGGYVRISPAGQLESVTRPGDPAGWSSGGTSHAALRSDGPGMVPGAGESRHLRVGSEIDPYIR